MLQKSLIFLLLALPTLVAGQTFQASVIGGFNFSQIDGDDLFGFHKPGINAGIRVVAILGGRWRVGPEILFSQQGAKRQDNSFNISPYDAFRLNTLEVPLMAYYKDWRLVAEAGFSYQRLFSYEVDDSLGQDITAVTELQDNLVAFKAGVTYLLNPNWGINMQWSKHVLDIDVENQINTSFKGRSVSLRLVYTFGQGEALPKRTTEE